MTTGLLFNAHNNGNKPTYTSFKYVTSSNFSIKLHLFSGKETFLVFGNIVFVNLTAPSLILELF